MTTIHFPAGTTHIRYSDMAHHIAKALHDDPWMYGAARVNLNDELAQAVMRGALLLRDPLTLGPHPMPIGAMRDAAIVLLDDLRDFLKGRRISVEVEDSAQASPAPATATQVEPVQAAPVSHPKESQEQRQARRYKVCIDAGLNLPDNDYAALPRGIGELAKREYITRQSFAEDVKAHIRRLHGR